MSDEGTKPPPGQDGAPPAPAGPPPPPPPPTPLGPPSEFNTPVVAPRPVDVEGEAPPEASTIARAPRRTGLLAIVIVLAIVGGIVAIAIASSVSGSGESGALVAPRRPHVDASVCGPPKCPQLQTAVRLSWTPAGGDVSSYTIERNGAPLAGVSLGPSNPSFTDDTAVFGNIYDYVVVAHGGSGATASSAPAHIKVPLPPITAAQLDGQYDVHLTVTKASNLGSLEGINNPHPGDTRRTTWTFQTSCATSQGACPTRWESLGAIKPSGRMYAGSFTGGHADCHPGTVPVHFSMHLSVRRARVADQRWLVSAFEGTYTVSFSCPGGPSIGTLHVAGLGA